MKTYENVFTTGQYGEDLWVRLFDTDTKKTEYKKFNSKQYVPPLFTKEQLNPLLPSTHVTFDTAEPLFKNDFKNTIEQKQFLKSTDKNRLYGSLDRCFHYIRVQYKLNLWLVNLVL